MNNTRKNTALIVDDEVINLDILSAILGPEYTVYRANGGVQALEMANQQIPDLILLDIIMPDIDGFQVLETLKNNPKTREIPVIIITTLNSPDDEIKGLKLGAADFISKPFSHEVVEARVQHHMQFVNQIRAIVDSSNDVTKLIKLQRDLEAAVEAAKAADRSKSAFLAKMSHEIRTPLNAVLGIAEVQLQNDTLSPRLKEALTRIFNSGHLLLGIINDILDMSKIEAGKLELISTKYDIVSLINDTVFVKMIKHEDRSLDFILNVDENVPSEMIGDELRIKQILNNLLSNAFKYTREGEVELSINAEFTSSDTVTLVFRVRDTGQGMTPDQITRLFEEYSRFNTEANRMTEGTGLGMGITQNLISMMNGEIQVKSEPNKGTLFTVRLPQGNIGASPLGKDTVERMKQFRLMYEARMEKIKITRESIPFGKVLVVDDMEMNLYVTREMLAPYGLQIDIAVSGHEAIEKVKNNVYDMVFMDHMMPVMDGAEATKRIRELGKEFEKLPIIALTANAVAGMKEMFLSHGFNGFVSKPVIIQELNEVLKEWMSPGKITERKEPDTAGQDEAYESFMNGLDTIEEINTEAGLKQLMGNKSTYYNTLGIFYKKLLPECSSMTVSLDAQDTYDFLISVHAMKSMLAIIGATGLSEKALALQIAARDQDIGFCMQNFPPLKEKLLSLHQQLSVIFTPVEAAAAPPVITPPAAEEKPVQKKVLLVDDKEMILYVVTEKLKPYGLEVDTASSGPEAVEKAKNGKYDLVLMDYMMPQMNGVGATREIRNLGPDYEKLPVIALTAEEDSGTEEYFLNHGLDGFLPKPVKTDKLEAVLKKWLPQAGRT